MKKQNPLAIAHARIQQLEDALRKIANRKPAESQMANAFRNSRNEAREALRAE